MLQWLYTYAASVCFKCFICFFRCMLQLVLFGCCICFTHMLQFLSRCLHMFCNGFQVFFGVFVSALDAYLQMFHLNVLKVDWVLYILQCDSPATPVCCSCWGAIVHAHGKRRDGALRGCVHRSKGGSTGSGASGPRLARACSSRGRMSGRPDTSKSYYL
jgi:hypothetical protein